MRTPSWKQLAAGAALLGTGAALFGHVRYRAAMGEAEKSWASIALPKRPTVARFDPAEVAGLPEVARRYFGHAIAPGTPLYSVAFLEMEGVFLLGDKADPQRYEMTAREVIRQPDEFVWLPRLTSGPMLVSGSDGLAGGRAWTRFFIAGSVPVAAVDTSPDMVRSAGFRGAAEAALWLPSTLLPRNGAVWEEAGPDQARVTIKGGGHPVTLSLTLDQSGAVREVVGQRWSNANPDKVFRLQPFGGTITASRRFGGFTIPSEVAMGNHFGTEDYLPFFQARVTGASYR
jgi:hypothetical protein